MQVRAAGDDKTMQPSYDPGLSLQMQFDHITMHCCSMVFYSLTLVWIWSESCADKLSFLVGIRPEKE